MAQEFPEMFAPIFTRYALGVWFISFPKFGVINSPRFHMSCFSRDFPSPDRTKLAAFEMESMR